MKVTNCLDCPFMVADVEFESIINDTILLCNLVAFNNKNQFKNNIIKVTDFDKYAKLKKIKPLKECPLKTEKITVEYEYK